MSTVRYYDDSTLKYFSNIEIEDGTTKRSIQCLMATPSRKGVKLDVQDENETPIMPLFVLTRTGVAYRPESAIIKSHITRPGRFMHISSNLKTYDILESMAANISYQLDIFALNNEMFLDIVEQLLYKVEKHHYIPVRIEKQNYNISDNAYISDVNYSDSTSYSQIADNTTRLFHGTLTFTVHGYVLVDENKLRTILREDKDIKLDGELYEPVPEHARPIYKATKEDLEDLKNRRSILKEK